MTPDQGYCEKCRQVSLLTDRGACVWCSHPVFPAARAKPKKVHAPAVKMPPEVVEEALALYLDGRSLRSIGREFLPRTRYANPRTMAQALGREFTKRGVRLRGHVEQAVIQSRKQARIAQRSPQAARARLERIVSGLPEREACSALTNRGTPCRLPAEIGSDVCHMHDPANAEDVLRRIRAMHAARGLDFGAVA